MCRIHSNACPLRLREADTVGLRVQGPPVPIAMPPQPFPAAQNFSQSIPSGKALHHPATLSLISTAAAVGSDCVSVIAGMLCLIVLTSHCHYKHLYAPVIWRSHCLKCVMLAGPDAWGAPGPHPMPPMGGAPQPVPFAAHRPEQPRSFHRNWGPSMDALSMGPCPPGHAVESHAITPAPPPQQEPYDILSFPAGLIPKLVRRHLQCASVTVCNNATD